MDRNSRQLIEKLMFIVNAIRDREKQPRSYGTGYNLYQSEIHTIEIIKNYPESNAGQIASVLGVTNGALTQTVSKLIQKNLVEKYQLIGNKKEIYYRLTAIGEIAYKYHEIYDEELINNHLSFLKDLNEDEFKIIIQFLDNIQEGIRNM